MHEILSKQNKLKDFKSDSSTVAFKSFRAQMISVDNGCSHKKKGWKRWQSISSGHSRIGLGTCWPRPGQKHAGRAAGHRWSRGKLSDHFSSMYFPLCSKYQTNQRLEHSCFKGFFFKYEEKIRQGYVLLTLDLSVSLLAKAGQNETSMPLKPRV